MFISIDHGFIRSSVSFFSAMCHVCTPFPTSNVIIITSLALFTLLNFFVLIETNLNPSRRFHRDCLNFREETVTTEW